MRGWRLGLLLLLPVVVLLVLGGTRLLERSLKVRLETALGQAFGCRVSSGDLSIHWPERVLAVTDLRLVCPLSGTGPSETVPPLVFVRKISARVDILSLLNRVISLDSLRVEGGRISAVSWGPRDNYRDFLARWVAGVHPAGFSGGATIRRISLVRTDLSVRMADRGLGVTVHALRATLRPNLFMNRFRLEVPEGRLEAEVDRRVLSSSSLRATATFAEGGVPDLEIRTRSPGGRLSVQGQLLSFGTEPLASLFVRGTVDLRSLVPLLSGGTPVPEGTLAFRSYLHGRVNRLRARAVVTSSEISVGGHRLRDLRVILSMVPGLLEARPVEVTVGESRIRGRLWASLTGPAPRARVRVRETGRGGLMGAFTLTASGVVPLPRRPEDWGPFLAGLGHLAGVS
ncbi:MAG: hypothetical protein D084_Lepto4C00459G0002 [Leptospirillum sp. Group IV 'UBA BS']|nr:MAG: hypothetical protein D084_Lepto4C00459G0002 [Leptospirillum sp. Group IV 'UBA BS']MCL5285377.1 hypothetical protein [Nitrospirota bacterium]